MSKIEKIKLKQRLIEIDRKRAMWRQLARGHAEQLGSLHKERREIEDQILKLEVRKAGNLRIVESEPWIQ